MGDAGLTLDAGRQALLALRACVCITNSMGDAESTGSGNEMLPGKHHQHCNHVFVIRIALEVRDRLDLETKCYQALQS